MNKLLILLSFFAFSSAYTQTKWMTMEEAMNAQKTQPKKILIDFYADWCEPCKIMEKKTYNHPEISKAINDNYYAVKFNAEDFETISIFGRTFSNPDFVSGKTKNAMHEFTKYMNVNAVPAIVFLDLNSQPITMLQGALTAKELEPYLTLLSKEEYKEIDTREEWEIYQKKYRSKIKD